MNLAKAAAILSVLLVSIAPAADYMPLKEGNQWTYSMSNGTQMTTKIVGFENVGAIRCAVAETTAGWQTSREYVAIDAQGVKSYMAQMQGQDFRYDPPVVRIKLPYRQGDTWQSTVNQFGMSMVTTFQSSGAERVQTPAGAFDCVKVQSSMSLPGQAPMTSTIWYAEGIGAVRQVMVMAGQEVTVTLASTNVKPAPQPQVQAAPTAQTPVEARCPKCGAKVEANAKFCPSCGAKLTAPTPPAAPTNCPKCNAKLPAGAKFCPSCGEKIEAPAVATPAQSTEAAAPTSDQPALKKYQSENGKVLLYKPAGWAVTEGEIIN